MSASAPQEVSANNVIDSICVSGIASSYVNDEFPRATINDAPIVSTSSEIEKGKPLTIDVTVPDSATTLYISAAAIKSTYLNIRFGNDTDEVKGYYKIDLMTATALSKADPFSVKKTADVSIKTYTLVINTNQNFYMNSFDLLFVYSTLGGVSNTVHVPVSVDAVFPYQKEARIGIRPPQATGIQDYSVQISCPDGSTVTFENGQMSGCSSCSMTYDKSLDVFWIDLPQVMGSYSVTMTVDFELQQSETVMMLMILNMGGKIEDINPDLSFSRDCAPGSVCTGTFSLNFWLGTAPSAYLSSITFKSDHGVLLNNETTWAASGTKYKSMGPDWVQNRTPFPITHSMLDLVDIEVSLQVNPAGVVYDLIGQGSKPFLNFEVDGITSTGTMDVVSMESKDLIPSEIAKITGTIDWQIKIHGGAPVSKIDLGQSMHPMYILYGWPNDDITVKRIETAVGLTTIENPTPFLVIESVLNKFGGFVGHDNPQGNTCGVSKDDIWTNVGSAILSVDYPCFHCNCIATFTDCVYKSIGAPGISEAKVIYAYPSNPTIAVESPIGYPISDNLGMNCSNEFKDPGGNKWVARLVVYGTDPSGKPIGYANHFESVLKLTYNNAVYYYPAGVLPVKYLTDANNVLFSFDRMVWLTVDSN
jgi:hypothetical protein